MFVTPRKNPLRTFTMTPELLDGIERLRERDGVPASTTVQRAVRAWLVRERILPARQQVKKKRARRQTRRRDE